MPQKQIVDVALELSARGEFVTMARFVGIVDESALRAVLDALTDDGALLRIAFFVEDKNRLDRIMALVPERRLEALIRVAASEADLWPQALSLMEHLDPMWRGYLGDLAAGLEAGILDSMVHSVRRHDLWSAALPVVGAMSEAGQRRFANLPAVQAPEMLGDILPAVDRDNLWAALLPVVQRMDDTGRTRVAVAADNLDGEQLLRIAHAAAEHDLWGPALQIVERMDDDQRTNIVGLIGMAPDQLLDSLMPVLEANERWHLMNAVVPRLHQPAVERLRAAADRAGLAPRLTAGT